eukprot:TRINITY_DN4348_c0_g1_i1.p2 TRINITY_DN4348_c0_g1~~TRINITY_DN4348_c0_g1_i1.p2  ORF type:complete len:75 (-),score=10.25 TRINITY_DN4348_c0_g1_i1:402-626(-)
MALCTQNVHLILPVNVVFVWTATPRKSVKRAINKFVNTTSVRVRLVVMLRVKRVCVVGVFTTTGCAKHVKKSTM